MVHYLQHPLGDIWTGITVIDGDPLLIVDTGPQQAVERTILPFLKAHHLFHGQPVQVVNTHCHCDHIGGNAGLKKRLGASIYAHQADRDFIENHSAQWHSLFGVFLGYEELAMDQDNFLNLAGEDTPMDRSLEDGDVLPQGGSAWEVIHTPGHSPGSISLFEQRTGTLLVGDSVQGDGTSDTMVLLVIDLPAYRRSLQTLIELDPALLISDHPFQPFQQAFFSKEGDLGEGEMACSPQQFLQESLRQVDQYRDRVERFLPDIQQPFNLVELVKRLAADLFIPWANPYLFMLASACLDELAAEQQVTRLSGRGWDPRSQFTPL